MADADHDPPSFRGARFTEADFSGAVFRDCDFRGARVVDALLEDVNVSGLVRRFVVNDVDVTDYVASELEKRHPERAQLRVMTSADAYRAMWDTIERLWSATVERARQLPEPARHEQVDEEWSFVETMRHLVFATDAWVGSAVLDDPQAYHRLGYPQSGYPPHDAVAIGIDVAARPSFDEVMTVRADRLAIVRRLLEEIDDAALERVCERPPAPGYPVEPRTVGACVRVVMVEECEHRRYALRDLDVLESQHPKTPDDNVGA